MDIVHYKPSPTQQEFHKAPMKEVLYGGAAGGGKSVALLWDIVFQLLEEHGRWVRGEIDRSLGWAIYFRRTNPRLLETLNRAHILFKAIDKNVHYDSDNHIFTFSCGYKAQFQQVQFDKDVDNFRSTQFTLMEFDEATEFSEYQYDFLTARVRPPGPGWEGRCKIRLATNPGPGWVKKRFVDPAPEGRVRLTESVVLSDGTVAVSDRMFIPAKLTDNPDPAFRREYEVTLRSRKNKNIVEMWLLGNWNFVDGAYFSEAIDARVHFVEPFKIPKTWLIFRSMDWGFKSPGTVGYWAVDFDHNLTKFNELNFKGLDPEQVADRIRSYEMSIGVWDEKRDRSTITGPADYAIWEERGNLGPSIAESFANCGVEWEKCTKNRYAGAIELIRRFNDVPMGTSSAPGIRIFKTCEMTCATLPSIPCDVNDIEVPQDGGDDHWLDETMYAVMYRSAVPVIKPQTRRGEVFDELEEQRKKKVNRGRTGYGH